MIDVDTYLLELVRYIHKNPVRAGIVKNAVEYPWSSHKYYVGNVSLANLTTGWELSEFGDKSTESRKHFDEFVSKTKQKNRRSDLYKGGNLTLWFSAMIIFMKSVESGYSDETAVSEEDHKGGLRLL